MPACPLLDRRSPINWKHPLNRGRVLWLYGSRGLWGGGAWRDLCKVNSGTLTNGPAQQPTLRGDVGLGLVGASTQYATTTLLGPASTQSHSVAAWVYLPSTTTSLTAVVDSSDGAGTGGGGLWYFNGKAYWFGAGTNASFAGSTVLSAGVWYRLVVTYDAAGFLAAVYVNGRLDSGPGTPGGSASWGVGRAWRVGAYAAAGPSFYLTATVSDVSVWNRSLSTAEVALDYALSARGYRVPRSPLNFAGAGNMFGVAAGGTFKPGWAYGATKGVLGSGVF